MNRSITANKLTAALLAVLALLAAVLLSAHARLQPGWSSHTMVRTVSLGYAVPGAVVVVGLLLLLIWSAVGMIDQVTRAQAQTQVRDWLQSRGLADWAPRAIGSLSQGQRQHVCWLALMIASGKVGSQPGSADGAMFCRLGWPAWLVAPTVEAYIEAAVRLQALPAPVRAVEAEAEAET